MEKLTSLGELKWLLSSQVIPFVLEEECILNTKFNISLSHGCSLNFCLNIESTPFMLDLNADLKIPTLEVQGRKKRNPFGTG